MAEVVEVNHPNFPRGEEHNKYSDGLKVYNYVVPWWVVLVVVLVLAYLWYEHSKSHQSAQPVMQKTVEFSGPAYQTMIPEGTPKQTRLLFRGY